MMPESQVRESLFKPFPQELTKFVMYNRHINLWYRLANKIPLDAHNELIQAIGNNDLAAFQLHYSAYTASPDSRMPIIINGIDDADTLIMFAHLHLPRFIDLNDFATEKLVVAQMTWVSKQGEMSIPIMPYALVELHKDAQAWAIETLPIKTIVGLDTSQDSPLSHLKPLIDHKIHRSKARIIDACL
jgi:hypothetical protein